MAEIQQKYVYVGEDKEQIAKIKTLAGTTLGGRFFMAYEPNGTKHAFWYNTGSSSAPTNVGYTLHEIDILTTDSASQVATKTATAMALVTEYAGATASGDIVTVPNATAGYCQAPHGETGSSSTKTGFSFEVTEIGMLKESIGCIQGDIEVSPFNYTTLEVKCHATGSAIVQELITGYENPTISFTLQDTSKAKIQKLFAMLGGSSITAYTADAAPVFGFGTELIGKAKPFIPVVLHPVNKSANDKSEDWNMWKTNMSLESFTFAAEDVATCAVSFKAYADDSKSKAHNVIMIGDPAHVVGVL